MSKRNKRKLKVEQNVQMSKSGESNPTEKKEGLTGTTVLKIQISEDAAGNISVEWLTQLKDTGVAIPMRPAHIIGQLEAAKHILCKQYYDTAPKVSAPTST